MKHHASSVRPERSAAESKGRLPGGVGAPRARTLAAIVLAGAALASAHAGAADRDAGADAAESPQALMARVEAMKAAIKDRPKTPEILLALGNLYFQNGRYLDAIDWYRQTLELARPTLARLDALPPAARAKEPSARARAACDRAAGRRTYEALTDAAERAARAGAAGDTAYCLRQAVAPALEAQVRRGNAFLLAGNPDQALADETAVLARAPDHADALFFTGFLLVQGAGRDPAKLASARDAWRRFLRAHPDDPRAARVREDLPALEARAGGGAQH